MLGPQGFWPTPNAHTPQPRPRPREADQRRGGCAPRRRRSRPTIHPRRTKRRRCAPGAGARPLRGARPRRCRPLRAARRPWRRDAPPHLDRRRGGANLGAGRREVGGGRGPGRGCRRRARIAELGSPTFAVNSAHGEPGSAQTRPSLGSSQRRTKLGATCADFPKAAERVSRWPMRPTRTSVSPRRSVPMGQHLSNSETWRASGPTERLALRTTGR